MKTKYTALLLFVLSHTTQVWAMDEYDDPSDGAGYVQRPLHQSSDDEWNPAEEESISVKKTYTPHLTGPIHLLGGGQATGLFDLISNDDTNIISHAPDSLRAEVVGFEREGQLPDLSFLTPVNPLPIIFDFGRSHKRVRYSFQHEGHTYTDQVLDTFTSYAHEAEWEYHPVTLEEQGNHKTCYDFILKVRLEDSSPHTALKVLKLFDHEEGTTTTQSPGKLYYDGETVVLRQFLQKKFTVPRPLGKPLEHYNWLLKSAEEAIPTHQESKVVFVEPIPISGERLPDPRTGYRGDYDLPGVTLPSANRKGNLTAKYLIYSDGSDIFIPRVTHELWERNGWRVGFGIASYQADKKLSFINSTIKVPEKGLYRLHAIKDENNTRLETWIRLGGNPLEIQITVPAGVSSIPGMGCVYVPPLLL